MLEIPDDQGNLITFVTATEAPEHLGADVTPKMVDKWQRRRKITGYRVGRLVYYRLDELTEVEYVTRQNPSGRPRRQLDQGH